MVTTSESAAAREYARNPLVASCTGTRAMELTTLVPATCRTRLTAPNSATFWVWRSPTAMSARPSTIGATRSGMLEESYWLSASVLTMTSAPSRVASSIP